MEDAVHEGSRALDDTDYVRKERTKPRGYEEEERCGFMESESKNRSNSEAHEDRIYESTRIDGENYTTLDQWEERSRIDGNGYRKKLTKEIRK